MGENNNRKSETITEKEKIKEINKELSKYSIRFEDLPAKTQKYIIEAENFFKNQDEQLEKIFKQFKSISFSIDAFCKYTGITRQALYKKNSNKQQSYKQVIDYINSVGPKYEAKRQQLIRDYIRTGTIDQKLMNSLLEKEIERMFIKRELDEKEAQIRTLESQVKNLERQLLNLEKMS